MKTILLIDDQREPQFIEKPWRGFNPQGYYSVDEVQVCRTVEEGVKALRSQPWDILLLDHDMGLGEVFNYTGMDVLKFLYLCQEHMPKRIFLVTANMTAGEIMHRIIGDWTARDLLKGYEWINPS